MSFELIPEAQAVQAVQEEVVVDVDALIQQVKQLEVADLFKVLKVALAEAERKSKGGKAPKAATKKKGSMEKGKTPPQLRVNRAWVAYVLKHALENGWDAYPMNDTKKDKMTGKKVTEVIEQPGSHMVDGAYVFDEEVTDKHPNGRQPTTKDAMSLSKYYWSQSEKTGVKQELYDEFLAQYVEEPEEEAEEKAEKAPVVRKTAAEKAEEKLRKAEEKVAEKERKAQEKVEEKKRKEEEKAAEKQRKAEEKEAAKVTKPVKAAVKAAPVKAAPVKAATPVKAAPVKAAVKEVTPVKAAAPVKAPAAPLKKKAVEEVWKCEDDGCVSPWERAGKKYLRNFDNQVWVNKDGAVGDWCGVYIPSEDRIDDSVPEPESYDEEDE